MANNAWATGHILCLTVEVRDQLLQRVNHLPQKTTSHRFGVCRDIFHAVREPNIGGHLLLFGLSHKYFGEQDQIGEFLTFWEDFITDIPANELFIAVEQEFTYSSQPFHKWYFQWRWTYFPKSTEGRWVFKGKEPPDGTWRSKFEVEIEN